MTIPGGLEVFLLPTILLLVLLGFAARHLLGWFREGYERGTEAESPERSSR